MLKKDWIAFLIFGNFGFAYHFVSTTCAISSKMWAYNKSAHFRPINVRIKLYVIPL